MSVLNFNEFTSKTEYWDPFTKRIEPSFFIDKNYYYILGPRINNSEGVYENRELKYLWKFRIIYNNNELIFNSLQNSKNLDRGEVPYHFHAEMKNDCFSSYSCINFQIKDKIGKIKYINQCNQYSGKLIMIWILQIMKRLGCSSCILEDQAEDGYVPISLIHKLWRDKTYYEYFDFSPYNKNNIEYKNDKMLEIDNYVETLRNMHWNSFDINHKKWTEFKNKYGEIYPSPFLAFYEFDFSNCELFYDVLNLLDNPSQHSYEILSKIKSIISKSNWIKRF